jgi:hypothetical protein
VPLLEKLALPVMVPEKVVFVFALPNTKLRLVVPVTVRVPLPASEPAVKAPLVLSVPFIVTAPVREMPVVVTVCPAAITTMSPVAGTPDGVHLEACVQAPLLFEVLVVCAKLAEAPVSMAAKKKI